MGVDEQRAIREALAPLRDWQFGSAGLPLVCPACLGNEWLDGGTVARMRQRERLPNGRPHYHFACPDCGLQVDVDFVLYDLGRNIPPNVASWN